MKYFADQGDFRKHKYVDRTNLTRLPMEFTFDEENGIVIDEAAFSGENVYVD